MEDIAQRAGVGVGTLYRAFNSRSGLAEAVFLDMLEQVASVATSSSQVDDPWEALCAWLRAYVEQLLAKSTMLSVLRPLFEADPRLLNDARIRAMDVFATLLARAQEAGVAHPDLDVGDLGPLVNGVFGTGAVDPQRADVLLDVIFRGMRA